MFHVYHRNNSRSAAYTVAVINDCSVSPRMEWRQLILHMPWRWPTPMSRTKTLKVCPDIQWRI